MSGPEQQRRGRLQLIMILVLFSLPPAAAWVVWKSMGDEGATATTNAGTLISPARPLDVTGLHTADGASFGDGDLRGRWTFVLFAPGDCDAPCRQQLYLTRQTRIAMNKDIPRVQRLLVLHEKPVPETLSLLSDEHTDLRWVVGDDRADSLFARFRGTGFDTGGQQYFLVDPLGNLMMFYDLEVPAKGVMKDLQKLLKISQVG